MATVIAIRNKTQSKIALKKVVEYVSQNKKVLLAQEEKTIRLLSGKDCCGDTAFQEFMATKRQHNKEKGRYFYQYVQSFKPGEKATPQQIHQMGLELAEYFKGYEVLVATHIDNDHWHNHLIVNSVSHETGLKLQFNEQDLNRLRDLSDEICKTHGLDTLEPYQKKSSSFGQREYRAALRGDSWKFRLMADIDSAMQGSFSKDGFISAMQQKGYSIKWEPTYKYITYTTPDGKKCRDNKLHEDKYLKEKMEDFYEHNGRTQTAQCTARTTETTPIPAANPGNRYSTGAIAADGAAAGRNPANPANRPSILEQLANAKASGQANKKSRGNTEKTGFISISQQSQMGGDWGGSAHVSVNRDPARQIENPSKNKHHDNSR